MSELRQALMQGFKEYRQASGRWNRSYEFNLNAFDVYCAENYHCNDLTQEMLNSWCLQRETESKASCKARTQVVRTFVRHLQNRNLTTIILPEPMIIPPNQYIPHAFTENELSLFFAESDQQVKEAKNQDLAFFALTSTVIFRLLYSSGMRTTEARLLKTKDVDLLHGVANINNTKANLQHYVVFHDDTKIMLERYDLVAQKVFPQREYFFPTSKDGFITSQNLLCRFKKIWKKISKERAVPYDLRHAYAITNINSWINTGFDFHDKLLYLSKSMGHTNLESTKYYYSLVPALSETILTQSGNEFDRIVPEVPNNG